MTDYEYAQTLLRPALHGRDITNQAEFINYVRPALEAAWKEEPQ